ncbi:polysaccharide deacetylase family protein [Paenibacillus thermotolerans]|uniref:polysaccharide deacetylase family protein n=1 Tax=Paenibacillus thermotolerans TaxID=3027807 RepID=UPI0023683928|nr:MULTISPECIES: polysaccharide deacetylase family protein [unclassified Paenibacillus]
MGKFLIMNCDDFGQSRSANEAIVHLLEERKVSSATIMAPALAFAEAAEWCRKQSEPMVGLHLTFTSEYDGFRYKSLTNRESLHDDSGYMPKTNLEFERKAKPKDVRREMAAQFEAVRRAGIRITHADNHMGSLYGLATGRSYLPDVFWQCARRGLPFRIFRNIYEKDDFLASIPNAKQTLDKVVTVADVLGVPMPDYLLSHPYDVQKGETYGSFKRMIIEKLYELPDGISETYIHPAVESAELKKHVPSWQKRVWEFKLMLDEDYAYALKDAKVTLTDYRYVKAHRRKPRLPAIVKLPGLLKSK